MNERDFELYRLSVVERMPECPYKEAVVNAIKHRLMRLDQRDAAIVIAQARAVPFKGR